jgi:hypothetical protein
MNALYRILLTACFIRICAFGAPVAVWTFEDGLGSPVAADTSGVSPAADGTLQSGAAIVTDPLGVRPGGVLYIPEGGKMTTPSAAESKFRASEASAVSFWVYAPTHNNVWWDLTLGKGGNGAPRMFINWNGTDNIAFNYASLERGAGSGGGIIDISAGAWGTPLNDTGWYHIGAQVHPYNDGANDGFITEIFINGILCASATTQNILEFDVVGIYQTLALFEISNNSNWEGYLDEVSVWNGYAEASTWQGLYEGTYTPMTAPFIVEGDPPSEPKDTAYRCNLLIDGTIDLLDIERFAEQWLSIGCVPPIPQPNDWRCADWNESGTVDFEDFAPCSENWLRTGFVDPLYGGPVVEIKDLMEVPTIKVQDTDWMLIPGYSNYYPNSSYISDFSLTGTKVYDFPSTPADWPNGLPTVWTGPDTWYYGNLDDYFNKVITADSDALIIPRLYLLMPEWWRTDPVNASEMEVMDDGTSQSIYYSQYSSNSGILPHSGPFPSLASQKWRQDMAYAIEHYIDHIQEQGYMANVAGFELSGLGTEEWYHWSSNRQELAGYSVPTRDAFRQWLRERYSDDDAQLQAAWSNPSITFDTVQVPSRADRKAYEGARTFRDPQLYMHVIDFYQFYNELIPDTIDYFAQVIKNKTANSKLVGAFYAYMYEFQAFPEFGHNALGKLNQSENLDYIYVTSSYQDRGPGGADLLRGPAYSSQLHDKLWYISNDTATIMTPDIFIGWGWDEATINSVLANLGYTDTVEKNAWMFQRAAGMNTCLGFYQNFFDLHGGYYNHPDLLNEVTALNQFYDSTQNYPRTSNSEVLVVSDEYSCNFSCVGPSNWSNNIHYYSLTKPQLDLLQFGAPADHILLDDLSLVDASQYKMVIFLNCYNMTDHQRVAIDAIKNNNRLLVFCYAPGYFNGNTSSISNMTDVCGMTLSVSTSETLRPPRVSVTNDHALGQILQGKGVSGFGPNANICKRIWVSDASATRLGYDPSYVSHQTMAIKELGNWESIYCVTAWLPSAALRELARYAGVHIYCETDDTLYANDSYVCIHAKGAGSLTVNWPEPVELYDAMTGTLMVSGVTSHTQSYQHGQTFIYRYEVSP